MFLKTFAGSLHPSLNLFLARDNDVRAGILNTRRRPKGRYNDTAFDTKRVPGNWGEFEGFKNSETPQSETQTKTTDFLSEKLN